MKNENYNITMVMSSSCADSVPGLNIFSSGIGVLEGFKYLNQYHCPLFISYV